MPPFDAQLARYQARAEQAIRARLPAQAEQPERLHAAMHYACQGGKRLRAVLVYACGELGGAPLEALDAPAAAVELLHAYSLVHDDLPAMDDADLRRGRPSCHREYDAGTAILAGDALQARAFELLSCGRESAVAAERRLLMVAALARAAGASGMCGGQQLDLQARQAAPDPAAIEHLHQLKTGALIIASARLGGLASRPEGDKHLEELTRYAAAFGLMYQVVDDLLDAGAGEAEPNYAAAAGIEAAQQAADRACAEAVAALETLPEGEPRIFLRDLARFARDRQV